MDSEDLARQAGRLAGWAARTTYSIGKKLPGADTAERGLLSIEQKALGGLRKRLESVGDPYLTTIIEASDESRDGSRGGSIDGAVAVVPPPEPLRSAMAQLLNRSTNLDRDHAREYLYAIILRQLTPDEARIMSALSDGSPFPLVDVVERQGLGSGRVVLRNASTVGKAAGVTLFDHVPAYVSRLVGLGLADVDDEVPALATQYEILLTDESVRAAEELVKRARFVRHALRISPLGHAFWQACDPTVPVTKTIR